MPKTSHRYSVVIPAYNEQDYIKRTLDSLHQQTLKPYEIIVVDNNSHDNTAVIAAKNGALVVKEKEPGVCHARQAGTLIATGNIVVSTDADTQFNKDWLKNIDTVFNQNNEVVAVAGGCRYYDGPKWGNMYTPILFNYIYFLYKLSGTTFYATATNIAFKKDKWSGYDTKLSQGGDELDLLRKLRKKGRVAFLRDNSTYTSGRRLEKGFIYNLFVTLLYYYLLDYYLSRIFNHDILGSAPKIRTKLDKSKLNTANITAVIVVILIVLNFVWPKPLAKHEYNGVKSTLQQIDKDKK